MLVFKWLSNIPLCPLPNPPSSHPLLPDAALLRSLARLALINVPGLHLALCLSFPPPSSLLLLHSTFLPCHPHRRDTSGLQLELVPVLSRVRTLHRCVLVQTVFVSFFFFFFCLYAPQHSSNPSPLQLSH